jgi:hypothetical protein
MTCSLEWLLARSRDAPFSSPEAQAAHAQLRPSEAPCSCRGVENGVRSETVWKEWRRWGLVRASRTDPRCRCRRGNCVIASAALGSQQVDVMSDPGSAEARVLPAFNTGGGASSTRTLSAPGLPRRSRSQQPRSGFAIGVPRDIRFHASTSGFRRRPHDHWRSRSWAAPEPLVKSFDVVAGSRSRPNSWRRPGGKCSTIGPAPAG